MKKDIYIIKNVINNKVYIGQAIDTKQRFNSHKSRASINSDNSPIHDAMSSLGVNNFYVEILESQIENYNERERYWIKYYNSIVPNGYNLLSGGEDPPYHKGEECGQAILTNTQAEEIKILLKTTRRSMQNIAKQYQVSFSCIRHLNYGEAWYSNNEQYPLRKEDGRELYLNNENISLICQLLLNSTCSMEQIGQYFNTNRKIISKINTGEKYRQDIYSYPIRKGRHRSLETIEQALQKIKEVKNGL